MQEIFNNREIAIGIWGLLAIFIFVFTKPARQFLKSVVPILFSRKFVIFYIIFLCHFVLAIYALSLIGFWNATLLKDTIVWIFFVELPLFINAIEKAKDNHFFSHLIKENIALIVVIEFVLNFWTFGLLTEFFIVPISVFIGLLYALAVRKKEHQQVKRFFDILFVILGIAVIINTILHMVQTPNEIISVTALKEFTLPILLLILNLPIVYGLALYNMYEQVFIRVKGTQKEKSKIKRKILQFAGINLSRITAIRNFSAQTIMISLTEHDIKVNLDKLQKRLSMRVGENYMKRAKFYIIWSIIGLLLCIVGIFFCNFYVSTNYIFAIYSSSNLLRIKEIMTYIFSSGIAVSIGFLFYSLGLRKVMREEISQVKKYSLHNLFYLIKRQQSLIQDFAPIDSPKELFSHYILIAYELKSECDKSVMLFENLLTTWELETVKHLQTSVTSLVISIGINEDEIDKYTPDSFDTYYMQKKMDAPQNEKINVFIHDVQKGIEKYTEQIKSCFEEFKPYI